MRNNLFARHLTNQNYKSLPEVIRRTHEFSERLDLSGEADVEHGKGILAGLIRRTFGFPPVGLAQTIKVLKVRTERGETWTRIFSGRKFESKLSVGATGIYEQFGVFKFLLNLTVSNEELHFSVDEGRFLGLPLPKFLLPQSVAKEFLSNGRFNFDVALYAPMTKSLIVRYQGYLELT